MISADAFNTILSIGLAIGGASGIILGGAIGFFIGRKKYRKISNHL